MPAQLKLYLVTFGFFLFAIFLGHAVAVEDYDTIALIFFLTLFVLLLIIPGYEFFIALGLVSPFILPLPFVRALPFVALILGFCVVKFVFTRSLQKFQEEPSRCATLPILILFGWVLIRYLMNPVKPNVGVSLGENVTGFRSYFNYGICGLLALTLGYFVRTREQVVKLIKWCGNLSLFFIFLLLAVMASGSLALAQALTNFGLFVGFFDTGLMRFVVLPGFGSTLLILSFLPKLTRQSTSLRIFYFTIGVIAIFMGGGRSSLACLFMIVLGCALVRRRILLVSSAVLLTVLSLVAFRLIGENYSFREGVGVLRVVSIVSRRVAEMTDADATYKWRQLRWERAWEDIKKRPIVGSGYGGLDNAFVFGTRNEYDLASIEIDVVAGNIHNGYIAGARALGIPASLLFLLIFMHQIFFHARASLRTLQQDPVQSDLHSFIFANLLSLSVLIYVGTDLNGFQIWFYIALGVLVTRLGKKAAVAEVLPENEEPSVRLPPVRPALA